MNPYAGMATRVKNVDDARKLLIQGQWSEWSQAITVPPAKYLFVTAVPPDGGRVGVALYEWKEGSWKTAQAQDKTGLLPGDMATRKGQRRAQLRGHAGVRGTFSPLRPTQQRRQGRCREYSARDHRSGGFRQCRWAKSKSISSLRTRSERRHLRQITKDKQRREAPKQPGVTPGGPIRPVAPKPPGGRELGEPGRQTGRW